MLRVTCAARCCDSARVCEMLWDPPIKLFCGAELCCVLCLQTSSKIFCYCTTVNSQTCLWWSRELNWGESGPSPSAFFFFLDLTCSSRHRSLLGDCCQGLCRRGAGGRSAPCTRLGSAGTARVEEADFDALLVLIAPPRCGLIKVARVRAPRRGSGACPKQRPGLRASPCGAWGCGVEINPSQRPLNSSRGECSLPGTGRATHPQQSS